jgi:hypothetical protein
MIEYYGINEKGPLKDVAERYMQNQLDKEKKRLQKAKTLKEVNVSLMLLKQLNEKMDVIMRQNQVEIEYLAKMANGPNGDVHYIKLIDYQKSFGEIFIDFIRGDKDNRSKLPSNSLVTYPYSNVFMIKITNDGPANIAFQTNRHARMIDLHAGESDIISENENFQLTELRIANTTNNNANVRIVVYA